MINFDSNDFVDSIITQTYAVKFRGKVYQLNATTDIVYDSNNKQIRMPFNLDIYQIGIGDLDSDNYSVINTSFPPSIFNKSDMSQQVVINWFLEAKIWDGKSFWDVESEMRLVG